MNVPLRADRRSGFTLIELLVSLVVLSLIALSWCRGLRFVVRAVASTDSRREALEELTLGLSVLRGELERAEPLMQKVGQRELVLFEGTPDRLRFVNVEPPYLAGPPYLAYEYAVALDDGSYRIDLRRAPFDPGEARSARSRDGRPAAGAAGRARLQFSYFGKLRDGTGPAGMASGRPPRACPTRSGWRRARIRAGRSWWSDADHRPLVLRRGRGRQHGRLPGRQGRRREPSASAGKRGEDRQRL